MAEKQLLFLESKGFYNKHELGRLSLCLGYPSALFLEVLHSLSKSNSLLRAEYLKCINGKPIHEKHIKQLVECKELHHRLDKNFNRYSSKYNIKVIKRSMSLLKHGKMCFAEISKARVAFELYSFADGTGLPAEVDTVVLALKMTDKVVSLLKLANEIQKQQHHVDTPSRIQLYEFFSLVLLSQKMTQVESDMREDGHCSPESQDDELSLPNFDEILMTSNQKMLAYLDTKYKTSLYREVQPTPGATDTEHLVSAAPRRDLKVLSQEQYYAFSPSLEQSQLQLHQARGGSLAFSTEQHRVAESTYGTRLALTFPRPHSMPSLTVNTDHCQSRTKVEKQSPCSTSRAKTPQSHVMPSLIAKPFKRPTRKVRDVDWHRTSKPNIKESERDPSNDIVNRGDCVRSVLKAREALVTSFCSVPQHDVDSNMGVSVIGIRPHTDESLCRPQTAPEPTNLHPLHRQPIVSSKEKKDHQGCIDDLRWATLRLNTTTISTSKKSPRKDSSKVHFHQNSENSRTFRTKGRDKNSKQLRAKSKTSDNGDLVVMSFSELPLFKTVARMSTLL